MAKEISIIRQEAQQVQNATQVGENTAQRVGGVLTDIVDKAEEYETDIDNLNSNMGVDEYPTFSESTGYSTGDVVNYNGKLYKFTSDHAAGAWLGTDVKETDAIKAHIVQEFGDDENAVISQKTTTEKFTELEEKKLNVSDSPMKDTKEEGVFFTDENGNVWMKFLSSIGLDVSKVSKSMANKILAFLSIVQETGNSEQNIMSQKGTTDALQKLSEAKSIEINNAISAISLDIEEEGVFFCNENGEVFARFVNGIFEAIGLKTDVISKFDSAFSPELSNPNESITLTNIPDVKNHYSIGASFQIQEMGTIKIFKSQMPYARGEIDIDATNIKDYKSDGSFDTIPHGLTITDSLIVRIDIDHAKNKSITLVNSAGEVVKKDLNRFNGCKGNAVVIQNVSGRYKNVSLSFSGTWFTKDTWIFGNSYTDYWPNRASDNGWTNYALDGFSGRNSEQAYSSLLLELKYGKPKRLVWMMGMNDADTEYTVNENWLTYFNKVRELCLDNNIQFIPCTIPNVPARIHTFKNGIIRESGLPYIDIAFAVGANEKGSSWYEGLLGSDQVHPTSDKGATVIAATLVAGVPDMAL